MKITVFGAGYVGVVTAACLADLGHEVLGADVDEQKIISLQQGKVPFYEPGLLELVQKNQQKGRLRFTSSIPEAIRFSSIIFNCVGTPPQEDGSANVDAIFSVVNNVTAFASQDSLIINKSTVPPGTARKCQELVEAKNLTVRIDIVSNPEFLAEGKAVYDFTHPDKIVIGSNNPELYTLVRKIYQGRVRMYIPFLETDWETAELIKYANNSFLATKISFINEIANISDTTGADVKLVAQALGMDYRINPRFLQAGVGYGGSCFPKDVRALIKESKKRGYEAHLLQEVDALNTRQREVLMKKIEEGINVLSGATVTVWGVAFKPKTSDTREAPALTIIPWLLEKGARVQVFDPIAQEEARKLFGNKTSYASTVEESVEGSSGIILLTEWDEFRNVDLSALGKKMEKKILIDGRNVYEPTLVREEGFQYYGVGRR